MAGWGGSGFSKFPQPLDVVPVGSTQVPGDTSVPDSTYNLFSEVTAVVQLVRTDITTYIIPATPIQHLLYIEFGGCNIAEYWLTIDGATEAKSITYFSGDLHGYWDFRNPGGGGKLLPAGKVVKIQVEHCRPDDGNFYARMCYMDIN